MKTEKEKKWDLNFSEYGEVEWDLGDVTYGHFNHKSENKHTGHQTTRDAKKRSDLNETSIRKEFLGDHDVNSRNLSGMM